MEAKPFAKRIFFILVAQPRFRLALGRPGPLTAWYTDLNLRPALAYPSTDQFARPDRVHFERPAPPFSALEPAAWRFYRSLESEAHHAAGRCGRFLLYGSLPIAYALAALTIVHLYLIALIGGIALVFFDIAQSAAVPRVVSPKQLPSAAALREGTSASADLLGAGIGGFLLGLAPTIAAGAALVCQDF